jgi:hypothetical protein
MKEQEMYDRLVEIVKQENFHEIGFSPANEHHGWMKEIRDLRATQDTFLLTGIELLAMCYLNEERDEEVIKFYHEKITELLDDEATNERVNKFFDEVDLTNE